MPKNAWDMVIIFILIKIYIMAGNHTGLANWQCPTRSIKHSPLSTWPNEAKICTPPAANTSLVAASSNLRPFSILIHLILFIWCLFSCIYTYTCRIHVRLFLKNAVFPYPRFSIPVLVSPYHVTQVATYLVLTEIKVNKLNKGDEHQYGFSPNKTTVVNTSHQLLSNYTESVC